MTAGPQVGEGGNGSENPEPESTPPPESDYPPLPLETDTRDGDPGETK